jgi:hypothetical protein
MLIAEKTLLVGRITGLRFQIHGGKMKRVTAFVLSCVLTSSAFAAPAPQATTTTTTKKKTTRKKAASSAVMAADIQSLKDAIAAQQQQIQQLQQQLQTRDQSVQQLQQKLDQSTATATQAQQKADQASSQATQQEQTVTSLKDDISTLRQNVTSTALTVQDEQKRVNQSLESPLALHYKGITITPGGFMAAESVYRTRALGADINTPFNAVPFGALSNSHISEFFGSGRQSRVAMLVEGKVKGAKLGGYVEADFLSAGVTSNNNQSNSYALRQRQFWGQAALDSGWSFTGGQMWSLATETKKGLDNRTEALPMTIDSQYTVGFSWARQYGFRVVKNFQNKVWFGFALENPQTTFAGHGLNNNFLFGSAGNGGGLYNSTTNYSFNESPDIIVKVAAEPGFGHYELFGIYSSFRDRVFPCATAGATAICNGLPGPSVGGAFNDSRPGGGVGANARVSVYKKHIDLGAHVLAGTGVGRYGSSSLPDATVRPDGTLALIKSYQALGTIEWHDKKLDLYLNGGGEYAGRTAYFNPVTGKGEGYGYPLFANSSCGTEPLPGAGGFAPGSLGSNCTGDTRVVLEGTAGFWYRLYNGPYGKVQVGTQYSYIARDTWSGTGPLPGTFAQPKGIDNIIHTSFRYYLP